MNAPLIELRNVSRLYPSGDTVIRALDDISLTIEAGEYVAIMGQSGSGKSTLMNILGCLDRPSQGSYKVRGRDTAQMDPDELAGLRRDTFGFVFQRYNLLSSLTALENVEIPAVYAGKSLEERERRAYELLTELGLGDRIDHKPNQLSGGQQQRVSVARALMNGADVILADEPTGALDSRSSEDLLALLRKLHASGRTIILITHDQHVAEHADRLIEFRDGKILRDTGAVPASSRPTPYVGERRSPKPLMQIMESVKMAFRSLRANLFRTSLTLLGVVIGVTAVVAMLALGQGAQAQIVERISSMGSNLLSVNPGAPGTRPRGGQIATLSIDDAVAIAAEVDNVSYAVPTRQGNATLRYGALDTRTQVQGVTEDFPMARGWTMAEGAFFTAEDVERYAPVMVIGATVAENLFPEENPIGEIILAGGSPYEVVGVLASKGAAGFGQDQDDMALIPVTTGFNRLFGQRFLSNVTIAVENADRISRTEEDVRQLLLQRHGAEDFQIQNTAEMLETVQSTTAIFTILLGSIAAISLVVGGIGVMNIMLVSVSERTREIGVRMATGARRSDIMVQFNTEALVVGALGGLIGVGLGVGIAYLMGRSGTIPTSITPQPAILAFTCALLTGLVFGYLPARKAARMDPVTALASE
jgi:macrolide transport system ATP-binding/permease protein